MHVRSRDWPMTYHVTSCADVRSDLPTQRPATISGESHTAYAFPTRWSQALDFAPSVMAQELGDVDLTMEAIKLMEDLFSDGNKSL